jgi:hypothetical protein
MTIFLAILGLFFLAVAVTMVVRALTTPAGPSTETLEQISAYGFAGTLPGAMREQQGPTFRARFDDLTSATGRWIGNRFTRLRGTNYRSRLIAAGMYGTTPERLLGTQFLTALGGVFVSVSLAMLLGASTLLLFFITIGAALVGHAENGRQRRWRSLGGSATNCRDMATAP